MPEAVVLVCGQAARFCDPLGTVLCAVQGGAEDEVNVLILEKLGSSLGIVRQIRDFDSNASMPLPCVHVKSWKGV